MKKLMSVILLAIVATAALAAQERPYQLNVAEFNELKVVDGINVDYICDPSRAGLIEFTTTKDLASAIMFEPKKGKLTVSLASRTEPYTQLPTVRVYSSYLSKVSNEGDSLVRVVSVAPGAKFSCQLMGNGKIDVADVTATDVSASVLTGHGRISIAGRATSLSMTVAGAGTINALDLKAQEVTVKMTGTGTIECNAEKKLTVAGVGGTVRYAGNPEIKKQLITKLTIAPMPMAE